MASGVPIVATRLLTHTQVLDDDSAVLVAPEPQEMADGIVRLMQDPDTGRELAARAKKTVEKNYSREKYLEKLRQAYEWVEIQIT
jgi:glycosyltransferase involved in cell wall biosynthesis